jgi:anti-sigma B factor antagonist
VDVGEFSIKRSDDATGVVLALSGELDVASAPELNKCLSELAPESHARVVLDLSELRFVDSPGINVLLTAKQEAQDEGRVLVLRRPTAQVQRVFAVLGLSDWLTLEDR